MTPRALARLLALVVALGAAPAAADDVPVRELSFQERGTRIVVWGGFTDVFDAALLEELSSGFVTTVVVRAYVVPSGTESPVSFAAATYRVVYDLWDEVYIVQVRDPSGERVSRHTSRAEALREATALRAFAVAPVAALPVGKLHYVAVVIEVNPVAPELLSEVRRWLTRQGQAGSGNSFFGAFISVFVNPKLADADRVLRFRSQDFYRVGP